MIEFGVCLLLVALAFLTVSLLDTIKDLGAAIVQLLDGIESHRRAQATGIFKHAGLLDVEPTEDE